MNKTNVEISNLPKYCNEALILAVLARGDRHGYQLAIEIEEMSDGLFKFNHGTLYPILHKLEKENLIKGLWEKSDTQRKRKYYSITRKGKNYFYQQKAELEHFLSTFIGIIGEKKK
ncbi:MAG: helix-turn-helix transcriptional regulator [Candidatus Latescibacteria bacterium]|nr:helix-turn-helix transcriptional regulator [Candidatus Latescibacterota bacterium]